jgi:hypothetical protein
MTDIGFKFLLRLLMELVEEDRDATRGADYYIEREDSFAFWAPAILQRGLREDYDR